MKSQISEFSYGFALTHEFVLSLGGALSAAPIFPSLIEEGKVGGGYDVKLEAPGIPLFLQFKRTHCLSRSSSREIKAGAMLRTPYYRFEVTGKATSDQHDMLIALDEEPNLVFYAAPLFHRKNEFDEAFLNGAVRANSIFLRPKDIGDFSDDKPHHVSFDGRTFFKMSDPEKIKGYSAGDLQSLLSARLSEEKRPLSSVIEAALSEAKQARFRYLDLINERMKQRLDDYSSSPYLASDDFKSISREPTAIEEFKLRQEKAIEPRVRTPSSSSRAISGLVQLADIGLREFSSQLYVIQSQTAKAN